MLGNIGERIKEFRKRQGLTQRELASRIGTTQQNLAQYENGKRRPKPETIQRIAKALDIPESFLTREDAINLFTSGYNLEYSEMMQKRAESVSAISALNEHLKRISNSSGTDEGKENAISLTEKYIEMHHENINLIDSMTANDSALLYCFHLLNGNGQEKALAYIIDLLKIPEYKRFDTIAEFKKAHKQSSSSDSPDDNTVGKPDGIDKGVGKISTPDNKDAPNQGTLDKRVNKMGSPESEDTKEIQ